MSQEREADEAMMRNGRQAILREWDKPGSDDRGILAAVAMAALKMDGYLRDNATKDLADKIWCLRCEHTHIPAIPVTTYVCADCGFGAWAEAVAEDHATHLPDHVVYPLIHQAVTPQ